MTLLRRKLLIRLFRDGHPVDQAVVKGRHICAGRDWRCQLVDPASTEFRRKLLVRTLTGYRINLPVDAEGTFTYKESTLNLDDLVAWGLARRSKRGYLVHHRSTMSAYFRIGNVTYELDYGRPPAPELTVQPAKQGHLPFRYRFQAPDRTDLAFVTLLTLILLIHIAGVRGLRDYPIPDITAIRELPRRISRLILEPVAPPPPQVTSKGETAGAPEGPVGETAKETEVEKTIPESVVTPEAGTSPPATRELVRSQVSKMGVLGVLTGRGTAGRETAGTGISVLQLDTELQQDLENVLGEIGGITTSSSATGSDAGFGGTDPGIGLIGIDGRISDANVSGPIRVSRLGTAGARLYGSPDGADSMAAAGSPPTENVDPEKREERSARTIARVVAAHTGAIRYAYNRELRKKPSLRGKIVLTFTISPEGEVIECHIEKSAMNWPPLENSLVKMVRTWSFPRIPEGDVTVSYPLVFFPSM